MPETRRVGRFYIDDKLIHEDQTIVLQVMLRIIVYRCEHLYTSNEFEYYAFCELFDLVKPGEKVPTYDVIFKDRNFHEFVRRKNT